MPFAFRDGRLIEVIPSSAPDPAPTASAPAESPIGAVVRFRSERIEGHGQIIDPNRDGRVIIRTWLPCRTKEVAVTPDRVTVLCSLTELVRVLR